MHCAFGGKVTAEFKGDVAIREKEDTRAYIHSKASIAGASHVVEHGPFVPGLQQLQHAGSVVVAHGLSCPKACGNLPGPGIKLVFSAL